MSHEVIKDSTGKNVFCIVVDLIDDKYTTYTTMDIGYTIAQNYREALIGENVYLTKNFPLTCLGFQIENGGNVSDELQKSGTNFYFDADGAFYFDQEKEPNPDRAVEEFLDLLRQGKVVFGPACAILDTDATYVHVEKGPGGQTTLYLYND